MIMGNIDDGYEEEEYDNGMKMMYLEKKDEKIKIARKMRTKMYQEKVQLPHRGEPKAENLDQLSRLRSPREPRPLA